MGRFAGYWQGPGRRCWPLVGPLLAAVLLGHGLLMAAETRAALPAGHAASERESVASEIDPTDVAPDDTPEPHHPAGCDVTHTAAMRAGGAPDLFDSAAASPSSTAPVPRLVPLLAGGWVEPIWPLGTRRAVFQVYRI